jgi:peptidoglycan/LPS O-acetylase OafA/YrhL
MIQTTARYRGDIDGLRAIAIILVIFFHAGFGWLASGFIGVDIFFVISGYLITGIILTQVREGKFSLASFFARRLWRIQPALIVVSLVTLVAASAVYIVPDYLTFLKSAKYNSFFLANQFFARQSVTYASPQSEFFPLLHTWSLSVEWQWYLFLPLTVLVCSLLSRRFGIEKYGQQKGNIRIMQVWLLVTAILTIVSMKVSYTSPGEAYYFLTTRAFEFTAGGSAFLLSRLIPSVRAALLTMLNIFSAVALILVSTKKGIIDIYPNGWTVAVVMCSAVLLFTGHYKEKFVSGALESSPVVFIGKLSYSLYLWHWPVFVFFRYLGFDLSGYSLLLALSIVFILAMAGYYLIENPLRKVRLNLRWTVLLVVIFPAILFSLAYSFAIKHQGLPQRLGAEYANQQHILAQYLARAGNRDNCLNNINDPGKCTFGDLNGTRSALVIGDSNSNHFWGFFDVLGKEAHVRVSALSASSCLTLPGIWQYDWWVYRNKAYKECHERTENYFRLIKQHHYNYVIIGEIWEQYANGPHLINKDGDDRSDVLSKARMNRAVREALNIITDSGARPVFIKTIFPMPNGYQECISKQAIYRSDFSQSACNAVRNRGNENAYIDSLFKKLKADYPSLIILDPRDIQCLKGKCISQIDSVPVYRDVGHLTDYASYRFGQEYLKEFGNPFEN